MLNGDIQDIRTDMYDGFKELTTITNDDIEIINDAETLWQAIEGEIKTPYGVIDGVNLENYGCRIWSLIGTPLTGLIFREAKSYISELADKYEEVDSFTKIDIISYGRKYIKIIIEVDSVYGFFEGTTHVVSDIEKSFTERENTDIIKSSGY